MKAQVLTGIRQMEMREIPSPKITRDTDVLLKIEAVGVCGSDIHYYETGRIGSQVVQYPFVVGHECAGRVVEVGASVKNLRPGQLVAVEPAVSCHQCDQCLAGRPHTCRKLVFLGCPGQIAGCLCEYLVMPAECCFPIDDKLTAAQGILCEPFAIGVYAVKQSQMQPGTKIAVLGAGPIGLSVMAASKALGVAKVYMTEIIEERLRLAQNNGADWVGNPNKENIVTAIGRAEQDGIDIVYECAGQQEALDQGIELLKPGGKMMLVGIPRETRVSFSPDLMRRKEITLINVRRQNHCTQKAIDLLAAGKVNLDFMVTHRFDFSQTQKAFDLVADYKDGAVKVIVKL
ncbi:MAG: zinc-binding dehydrogenase [Planctomycetes bacterium]|nr:zinc-binding dehydrogenase [Planctomycetota bacterium]